MVINKLRTADRAGLSANYTLHFAQRSIFPISISKLVMSAYLSSICRHIQLRYADVLSLDMSTYLTWNCRLRRIISESCPTLSVASKVIGKSLGEASFASYG